MALGPALDAKGLKERRQKSTQLLGPGSLLASPPVQEANPAGAQVSLCREHGTQWHLCRSKGAERLYCVHAKCDNAAMFDCQAPSPCRAVRSLSDPDLGDFGTFSDLIDIRI